MSSSLRIETVLRLIATAAQDRRPLQPILRSEGGGLGQAIADDLDRGMDLPTACTGHIPDSLRALLLGPHLSLEESALLVADRLRLDRQLQLDRLECLLHPLLTLACIPLVMGLIIHEFGLGLSVAWMALAALLLAGSAVLLIGAVRAPSGWRLPLIAPFAFHLRMSWRYERAALLARWRLSDAQLAPLLGQDLTSILPLLAAVESEVDARSLARFHRDAAQRWQRRLSLALCVLLYGACGTLLLAAAVGHMQMLLDLLGSLGDQPVAMSG